MPQQPFQITGLTIDEIKYQANELLRILFEDRIGGYDKSDLKENTILSLDSSKNVVSSGIHGEELVYYSGKR